MRRGRSGCCGRGGVGWQQTQAASMRRLAGPWLILSLKGHLPAHSARARCWKEGTLGLLAQWVEAAVLNTACCRFESDVGHVSWGYSVRGSAQVADNHKGSVQLRVSLLFSHCLVEYRKFPCLSSRPARVRIPSRQRKVYTWCSATRVRLTSI